MSTHYYPQNQPMRCEMNTELSNTYNDRTSNKVKDRYSSHKNWNATKRSHAEKLLNKGRRRKSIRRNWVDVKKDLEFIDDFNIESMIRDEIESIFHESAYPESDWQKLERLNELAELKKYLYDFEYK